MIRKVVVNLVVSLFVVPILALSRHWGSLIDGIKNGIFRYEDAYYDTFWEYIKVLLRPMWFVSLFFFVLILIPFQVIKGWRYTRRKNGFSLWVKCLVLTGIICFWAVFLPYVPSPDWQDNLNLLVRIVIISIPVSILLYFMVDRYSEK
ncbi:hypothetical protein ACFOET_11050 [Parapedobacter deserti]|uniref:Uncharacterized protein n=1 Tax=Parapedobacter deserti TaxID=1912957 RepID=A0ABV7JMV5_9SPHI